MEDAVRRRPRSSRRRTSPSDCRPICRSRRSSAAANRGPWAPARSRLRRAAPTARRPRPATLALLPTRSGGSCPSTAGRMNLGSGGSAKSRRSLPSIRRGATAETRTRTAAQNRLPVDRAARGSGRLGIDFPAGGDDRCKAEETAPPAAAMVPKSPSSSGAREAPISQPNKTEAIPPATIGEPRVMQRDDELNSMQE